MDLANYNFVEIFSKDGYDIYKKDSDFYNDICTPAYINNNDIILEDRKKDIYPNNVTLCKDNCEYKDVDIENKRIICECNFNSNYSNNNLEDESTKEEDENFISYFLDNINYKIFKCYHLLLSFENLIHNPAFYIILIIFVILMFFSLKSIICGIENLRILMYKEMPTKIKVKQLMIKYLKKMKNKTRNKLESSKINTIYKKEQDKKAKINYKRNKKYKSNKEISISTASILKKNFSFRKTKNIFHKEKNNKQKRHNTFYKRNINIFKKETIRFKKQNEKEIEINDKNNLDSYNLSPYTKALREDKRNIFQIIKFFIFEKIDILNLITSNEILKEIEICQYIIYLILGFLFNTLLYTDEIISQKYHNNGKLEFIVSLTLSLSSNIITAIIIYFIDFLDRLRELFEEISQIKSENEYLYAFVKFLKYIKLRITIFVFSELIIMTISFYFINIFCILYSKSQKSLLFNYFSSLLEGLIKSLIVITLIVITRKIGVNCKNMYIFNTSKYIDKYF